MQKTFASSFASLTLALALSATAAFSQGARFGIGVAATGQLPVGDLADAAGLGFGGLGGIEIGAYPGLAVTARSGYFRFAEKENNTLRYIPIMGGVKATGLDGGLYMAAEAGAVLTRVDYDGPLFGSDANETNVGWSVGVGSMAGALDVRLSLGVWDAAKAWDSMTLGLSIGLTAFSW